MSPLLLLVPLAVAKKVTVPVDIGIGPAPMIVSGPVAQDQLVHGALLISVEAIIDKKTLRQNKKQIPKQYREQLKSVNEVRISPSIWIPDTLILSPPLASTQIWGVGWEPVSLSTSVGDKIRLKGGLVATLAYLHSDTLENTVFVRPGASLGARFEQAIVPDTLLIELGWTSRFYPPQLVGGGVLEFGGLDDSIWHMGHGYLKLHYRFPYTVKL